MLFSYYFAVIVLQLSIAQTTVSDQGDQSIQMEIANHFNEENPTKRGSLDETAENQKSSSIRGKTNDNEMTTGKKEEEKEFKCNQ
ncbi:hypothetical protein ACH3XW_8505 [Acanthocheilonema viteae]